MAVSGVLGWLNIRGLKVQIEVPDEIYSGVDTLVTMHITSTRRYLPSFLLTVELRGIRMQVPILAQGGTEIISLVTSFAPRGTTTLQLVDIYSPYPVNFFVRCNRLPVGTSFPVFPTPLGGGHPWGRAGSGKFGTVAAAAKGYEGEVAKISEYSGAEPLKMIHWRLSAKHETLKVKVMATVADDPVILDLERLPGRGMEERLSLASWLINQMMKEQRPVGLKLGEKLIKAALSRGHRLKLLEELALYGKD